MDLNWTSKEYFATLICHDDRANVALEMLVDDLHAAKERTIRAFLCHSGSEDFLWGLVRLLGSENARVAGNAAYILGTVAENELGCYRIIAMTAACAPKCNTILIDLTNMLAFDDSESMMNAAGTIGTLAESAEGRAWMLKEDCLNLTISHITTLLSSDNLWTSSNAALVLARLTISEEGCLKILNHEKSDNVLAMLITSLGTDEAGRGMNAAFAIGRLCDMEASRARLLKMAECEKMISSMGMMLSSSDPGTSKNACFALSCLAMNKEGHMRLLKNTHTDDIVRSLSELISAEDAETAWFAAMTLRTLATQPKGCLRLRSHPAVIPALKAIECRSEELSCDLRDEVLQTLNILKRLSKPSAPSAEVSGPHEVEVSWEESKTKCKFDVMYHLYEGSRHVYYGKELCHTISHLEPCTQYSFKIRASTEGDDSPFSDSVTVVTEENVPGPPENITVLASTTTQLKIGWQPPLKTNGVLKGYYVFNGKSMVEHTSELNAIISGLQSNTTYELQVCAATSKGKGTRVSVVGATSEQGAHAPSKPEVFVLGRKELQVSWKSPEVPLGRISRYDLSVNGEVVYSGTDLYYAVRRLKPDTEYVFMVTVITNEGRCDSKATRKRTAKDEYEGDRAPLYPPPTSRRDTGEGATHKGKESETPPVRTSQKKRRSIDGIPHHVHQGVEVAGRSKPAAARSASASSGKGKTRAHNVFVHSKSDTKLTTPAPNGQPKMDSPRTHKPHHEAGEPAKPERGALLETAEPDNYDIQKEAVKPREIAVIPLDPHSPQTAPSSKVVKPTERPSSAIVNVATKDRAVLSTTMVQPDNDLCFFAENTDRTPKGAPQSAPHNASPTRLEKTRFSRVSRSLDLTDVGFNVNGVRRRTVNGTMNGSCQEKRKESMNEGALEEERKQEELYHVEPADPAWIAIAKRAKSHNITRSFTALQMSMTELAPLLSKTSNLSESAEVMFPTLTKSNMPPSYLQRAKTFTASHRPPVRKRDTLSEMLHKSVGNLPGQWQPDFPPQSLRKNRHNKFVPMQMRTQPMNLPGSAAPKQPGGTGTDKGNWAPLEVGVLRSKTTMSPSAGDPELDNVIGDVETEFSLTPRRQYNHRGSGHGALKPVKEGKLNLHTLSTSRGIDDAMPSDFDVELMPSSENNKLQSAR